MLQARFRLLKIYKVASRLTFVLLALFMSLKLYADTSFKLGGLSTHLSDGNYNAFHRLVIISHNDYFGGYFRNSFDDDSFVLGRTWHFEDSVFRFNLHGGVVYGYRKSSHCYKAQEETLNEPKVACLFIAPEVVAHQVPLKPSIAIFGPGALVLSINLDLP